MLSIIRRIKIAHRFSFIILIIGILVSLTSPSWSIDDKQTPPTTVTAVILRDSPPTYFLDKTGKPAGFAVDIMNHVAERAKLHVDYVFAHDWTEISRKIIRGEADLSPGMGISDERKEQLAFTSPIDAFPVAFFVRAQNREFDETGSKHTVGVIQGSVAQGHLEKNSKLHIVPYESFQNGLFDLLAGRIDAFACPAPTLFQLARESGVEDKIKMAGKPIIEIKRAIVLHKDNLQLLKTVNAALEGFVGQPEYQRIYTKWYGRPVTYWTPQKIVTGCAALIAILVGGMLALRYSTIRRHNRELISARAELEKKIDERTFDLRIANEKLEHEIAWHKDAAKALSESENRYHALFDQSPDGVILIDIMGKLIDFNEKAHSQLGYSREEFAKLSLHDIDPVESPRDIQDRIKKVQKEGKAEFEVKHRTKTGEVRDVLVITQALMLFGGPVNHGIWRDVTERKRVEETLRKSEELLRQAVRVSQIGIFDHDHAATTIYWSPEQRAIYGWGAEEAVTLPAFVELIHPGDREAIATAVRRAHDPAGDGLFDVEYRILRRDGEVRWLSTRSRTFFDGEGDARRPVRTVGASLDITERKRMERSLKESEEKFHTLFESANDAIFILSLEGRFLDINRIGYERLGYTKEEMLSKHISEIVPPAISEKVQERFSQIMKQGHSVFESAHVKKDGTLLPVEVNVRIAEYGGKLVHLSIARDITERKNAEYVLRRSHDELEILVEKRTAELTMLNDQLRNLAAHLQNVRENERTRIAREIHDELGQSLTALKMDLSLLRKRLPSDQKLIIEKAESMAGLIDATIQSVKRISADLRPGILDHLGLTAAIEWQAQEFKKRSGIPCEIVFKPKEIELDKDRTSAVFRIFQETLTNVARHAKATNISVLLQAQATSLLLQVKDNGKGITESEKSDPKSLGLIGIRERVNNWGGSLTIAGVPDQGTTVTVRLPLDNAGVML